MQEQARETVRFLIEQLPYHPQSLRRWPEHPGIDHAALPRYGGYSIPGRTTCRTPAWRRSSSTAMMTSRSWTKTGGARRGCASATANRRGTSPARLVAALRHSIDTAHPMVDASHIHHRRARHSAVPAAHPRRSGRSLYDPKAAAGQTSRGSQLIRWGTASEEVLDFLEACLDHGVSVSIAGKTGSGKTTLLPISSTTIDERQRIVTIEETREILIVNPVCRQTACGAKACWRFARAPATKSGWDIDMRALLRTALRLRPDIITMAEMRGPEALDAQEAARTGHTVASTPARQQRHTSLRAP